jgi:RNA polymerase sigma-70 factor (ECF subfamily)
MKLRYILALACLKLEKFPNRDEPFPAFRPHQLVRPCCGLLEPHPSPPLQAIDTRPDLERLFRESAEDLARYFTRRHGGGAEPTRDLVQETFLEMARGIERGARPRSLRAYLFGIARHVSLAAWKRRDREQGMLSDHEAETIAATSPDERVAAARETIDSLPPLQREILDLRFAQQLSYAEIAEVLGIPVGTVRSRLHHAIAMVRERIAAEDSVTEHRNRKS